MLESTLVKGQTVGWVLRFAILSTALPDTGAGSVIPILELMMRDMPNVSPSLIQMMFTVPSICLIICPPLYNKIVTVINRRTLLIVALVLFLIGSIGPIYSNNIYIILLFRFLLGTASGIYSPITIDLAVSYFEGDSQRELLGYCYCFTSIGGILYQTLGGFFGATDWHQAFWANMIAIPFFLFAILFVPGEKREQTVRVAESATVEKVKVSPTFAEVALLGVSLFNEMCLFVLTTCSSTYIIAGGYGDSRIAGLAVSMFMVGGILISPMFCRIFNVFRWHTLVVGNLFLAAGLGCYALGDSIVMCFVGATLCGFAQALFLPCMQNLLAVIAPSHRKSTAPTLTYTARGLGGFISPYVFALIYALMGTAIGRPSFIYGTIVVGILILSMLMILRKIKPVGDAYLTCPVD